MIGVVLAVLAAQTGTWQAAPSRPTVGDTVVLTREIPALAGTRARARPLEPSDVLEPLSEPVVGVREGRIVLRYAVAFFRPGPHRLAMPVVELVHPDGGLETLVGDTAVVEIASVIPSDSTPPPRASRAPVARPVRRLTPFLLLVGAVLAASGAWGVARRRRDARPSPPAGTDEPPAVDLLQWLAAGEARAAASYAMERVRTVVAELVPAAGRALSTDECLDVLARERGAWPLRELRDLLRELDRARFAPLAPSDAGELIDRADQMIGRFTAADASAGADDGEVEEAQKEAKGR